MQYKHTNIMLAHLARKSATYRTEVAAASFVIRIKETA